MSKLIVIFVIAVLVLSSFPPSYSLEALKRVPIESPRLVNAFGNPVFEHINVNQQVQIASDLTNYQNIEQDFVYIVQIKNSEGIIISVNWISGSLVPGQSFSPSLSWFPENAGTYTAKIFVWKSMSEPDPLSDPAVIVITAS